MPSDEPSLRLLFCSGDLRHSDHSVIGQDGQHLFIVFAEGKPTSLSVCGQETDDLLPGPERNLEDCPNCLARLQSDGRIRGRM
jgi:hypothetical protein